MSKDLEVDAPEEWLVPCYLDASALVKLVVDEGDVQPLRDFVNSGSNFCTTPFCLNEALSILKGKWRRKENSPAKISEDDYFNATQRLVIDVWSRRLLADDIDFINPETYRTVEAMATRHQLDLSDALQLVTIQHGFYKALVSHSAPALITADQGLADAAAREGIRVWHCVNEPRPRWLRTP